MSHHPPPQGHGQFRHRKAPDAWKVRGVKQGKGPEKTYENLWWQVQEGLLKYFVHSSIIVVQINAEKEVEYLNAAIHYIGELEKANNPSERVFAFGVRPDLWLKVHPNNVPVKEQLKEYEDNAFKRNDEVYTGGDIFFWLKATTEEDRNKFGDEVTAKAKAWGKIERTDGFHRHDRTILGGFVDGITNPIEPALASNFIISNAPDSERGGCFGLIRKFLYDQAKITVKYQTDLELAVGRTMKSGNLNLGNKQSHIIIARTDGAHGDKAHIIRLPYLFNTDNTTEREEGMYFVGLAGTIKTFNDMLNAQMKKKDGSGSDHFLNLMKGLEGSFWWFPTRSDLKLLRGELWNDLSHMVVPFWQVRSNNGLMFYNMHDYLFQIGTGQYKFDNPPSTRILRLVGSAFTRWGNTWYHKPHTPHVPHLNTFLKKPEEEYAKIPVPIRKGLAMKYTLSEVVTRKEWNPAPNDYAETAGLFRISADEIIIGVLPATSFGLGKEVMPYLVQAETLLGYRFGLSEASNMGHIIPDHAFILEHGLDGVLTLLKNKSTANDDEKNFIQSAILAVEGVQLYLENWAKLARDYRDHVIKPYQTKDIKHLTESSTRLDFVAHHKPQTLVQAAQLIFTIHACLHLTGEPVSIGRLDSLLAPYTKSTIEKVEYTEQEILDAFFLKFGERVLMNRLNIEDHSTNAGLTVAFRAGPFGGGSAINQWGQQITVGGYKAQDKAEEINNAITLMSLRSIRRLPLNAPCLSLRVTPFTRTEIVEEAAKALLSGGAHPVVMNDDRLCPALHSSAFRGSLSLSEARDYSCDGCYEPMISGRCEFTFLTVNTTQCIEYALNEGAAYQMASNLWMRGSSNSFRSPPAKDIATFDQFLDIYKQHLNFQSFMTLAGMLDGYGNLHKFVPSPLLSILLKGCLDRNTDYTNGGAQHRILSLMFVAIANTANSLYAIKKLAFDVDTKVCTLPELLECLICDWGHDMKEPFASSAFEGESYIQIRSGKYQKWREIALNLPKFGSGNSDVDVLGHKVVDYLFSACDASLANPLVVESLNRIDSTFKTKNWMMCPGVGSFEGYVSFGSGLGASAEGRRSGMPIASDFSAAPLPQDLPVVTPLIHKRKYSVKSWDYEAINKISNGSAVDFNIHEDFALNDLIQIIEDFKHSKIPANILTFTCANPDTYSLANAFPTKYELLRVRTGGWSEFFIAMFDAMRLQNERRQYIVA